MTGAVGTGDVPDITRIQPEVAETPINDLITMEEQMAQRTQVLDALSAQCELRYGIHVEDWPASVREAAAHTIRVRQLAAAREESADRPRRRRHSDNYNSDDSDDSSRRRSSRSHPSHMNPEAYKGESQKELDNFIAACHRVFDYSPREYKKNRRRVTWAATFLRDTPADSWERKKKNTPDLLDTITWEEFQEFLQALQKQPRARRNSAVGNFFEVKQQEGESVVAFVSRLEKLEEQMDPFSETQLKDNLLHKLRPSLYNALMRSSQGFECQTRDEVIAAASLQEGYKKKSTPANP
jgi:hypothetical protein